MQPRLPSSFARNRTRLWVGLALAVLMVVLSAVASVVHLRHVAEQRAYTNIHNMARSIEQSVEGRIDTIDVVLHACADEVHRLMAEGKLNKPLVTTFFERQMQRVPAISYLRATNAQGDIIYGNDNGSVPRSVADRDYFIRLRDEPTNDQMQSQFVISRVADRWSWLFIRRISEPGGAFGGVVIAGMFASEIESNFSALTLDSSESISLRDAEMRLIARYATTSETRLVPGDQALSPTFAKALAEHPDAGDYVSGSTRLDGINRIHTYRRNPKYGFNINIGISTDDAFSGWRKQVALVFVLVVAFTLISLVFARIISRAWHQQEGVLAELDARQASLDQAQHIARLGRYTYDLKNNRWTSCDILDDILGIDTNYSRDAEGWLNLVAPESRAEMQDYLRDVVAQRQTFDREYRVIRPQNDEIRWVHGLGKIQLNDDSQPLFLVGTMQDITEHKHLEERLHHEATTDKLTGAANRRRFLDLANNEITRAQRLERPLSLAIIDIDRFKEINDEYGHLAGDRALCELAQICRRYIREIDIFARLGGDEFVLLLPEASPENAFETIERIREALAARPLDCEDFVIAITLSSGIAGLTSPQESLDMLINRADKALYASKRAGRNRSTIGT